MLPAALTGLCLAAIIGWLAARVFRRAHVEALTDTLESVSAAALAMVAFTLTGHWQANDIVVIALIGAWLSVGIVHAMNAVVRRLDGVA